MRCRRVLGNPAGPVWRGEIQAKGLGLAIEVFDEHGRPLQGEAAQVAAARELVATGRAQVVALSLGGDGAMLVTADACLLADARQKNRLGIAGVRDELCGANSCARR